MSKSIKVESGGLFPSLLQVLFIGLKLGGVIDWSWWWVMAPTWGSILLGLLILFVFGVCVLYLKR